MSFKQKASHLYYKMTSKLVVTTIGFIALAMLIWFGGPLVSIGESTPLASPVTRLGVLLFIAIIWGVLNLTRKIQQEKRNEKMTSQLMENDDQVTSDEISQLRKRMQEAIDTLKNAKLYQGKSIYQLPWYLMIGPPGSGKTTVIHNSGLDYPLRESLGIDMVKGIGGTRNCDWWFTNKAVLIDTAGRYTTQDSHATHDSGAWQGFLGLLRKYRPLRPINGVIISMGILELMNQTKTERNLHARAIKQRLQELQNQLGMTFPVYFMLSKADLIAGFEEFFDDFSEEETEQVWGVTFPLQAGGADNAPVHQFNKEFHHLISQLTLRLNKRLSQERDIERRSAIFEFPRQLRVLQGITDTFLKEIFTPNAYEEIPMLRGVYLSSSTQEGNPENLLTSQSVSKTKNTQSESRSYFVKRVLEQVIFPEQDLASTNRHHAKQNKWLRVGTLTTASILTLGLSISWYSSYHWNQALLDKSQAALTQFEGESDRLFQTSPDLVTLSNALDRLRDLPMGYTQQMPLEETAAFGYDTTDDLNIPSVQTYQRALQALLSPVLTNALIDEMKQHEQHLGYLYETLKVYLMLYFPEHFNREDISAWFAAYLERKLPGDVNLPTRVNLEQHFATLLSKGISKGEQDLAAVKNAQIQLTKLPLVERAYQRLKADFLKSRVPDFTLIDVMSNHSTIAFQFKSGKPMNTGIPGLYTYNGYHSIFNIEKKKLLDNLLQDSWVYGDDIGIISEDAKAEIEKELEYKYLRDYVYYWEDFLDDLTLKSYANTADGAAMTEILSGPEAPIKNLVTAAQKNIRLTSLPISDQQKSAAKAAASVADKALHSKTSRLKRLLPADGINVEVSLPGKEVELAFANLLEVSPATLDELQSNLRQLHRYLDKMADGDAQSISFKSSFAGNGSPDFMTKLNQTARSLPMPFEGWIRTMSQDAQSINRAFAGKHLNEIWKSQVLREYRATIAGRYPFSSNSKKEVRMKDFTRFFGPQGTLDKFFNRYLKRHVDTSKSPWRFESNIGLHSSTLIAFERADKIRKAFFEGGSNTPHVEFGLKPVYLDSHVSHFLLEVDGQSINYRHGPQRVINFVWPGDSADNETRIVFTPPGGERSINTTLKGEWSFFRMLDEIQTRRPSTKRDHELHISLNGNHAQLKMIPSSSIHPFWSANIEKFKCPNKL
ncbi:type VI secretion system membrane subunit TssM [Algicola sagamiensis]|uniref:type VI secretion system membrane subunit TssM n=1 Tax=Algicola sagamiensis TaxID=163869 RepID=UPI000373982A|nr:type VI secretion system membrane subunit TssM [Algicola sagamiensis]